MNIFVQDYPWYYDTANGYENTYGYHNWPEFILDVENWGTDDATGVVVTYKNRKRTTIPHKLHTRSRNNKLRLNNKHNNMEHRKHATSGMAFMIITTQAIATGNQTPALTTTATLTHVDQYDTPNNYKTRSYSIIVPPNANVQVNQTQTTNTQGNNKTVTYTITTTNNGPDNATGIQITDNLPKGLTYTTSSPSTGTYDSTTGIWNIGNMTNGTTLTLTITATITGTGTITNTAELTAEDQDNWNYNNNAQTLDLTITGQYTPKVDIYVQDYPWYYDTANGYENTYSYHTWPAFILDVENWGTTTTGVVVTYKIGSGLQYLTSCTQGVGTTSYDSTTNTITWNIGNMPTSGMAFMIITTQAIATGNQTPALTTTATLTHVDQYDTPNNYKTQSYSIIVPPNANVQVNQTQTTNNNTVTYTITTTNNGPDNATGVQITDNLPTGLTYTTSNPSTGTYNSTTGIWNIGNIPNGTTLTLTITATITRTGTITNTAELTAEDQDNWNYNNNAQTTTTEKPQ